MKKRQMKSGRSSGIAIVLLVFLVLSVGDNLHAQSDPHLSMIKNGDFEDPFTEKGISKNWYAWPIKDGSGIVVNFQNDSHPHDGNGAQQISCSAYKTGAVNFLNKIPIPIRDGHTYKISLFMKGIVHSQVTVMLQKLDALPHTIFMEKSFDVSPDWTHYEFTVPNITWKGENCDARLKINFSSTGSLSIDNVKVYDLDKPVIDGTVYLDSDPDIGNDENDGKSPSAPWLTIEKIYEYDMLPGARVLFKSGGEWRGQVIVPSPGDYAEDAIYYGSYGPGERPIMNGAIVIENWKAYDDGDPTTNIYVAENVTQPVSQLIVDGRRQIPARYPNLGHTDRPTFNIITSECSGNLRNCLVDSENLGQI